MNEGDWGGCGLPRNENQYSSPSWTEYVVCTVKSAKMRCTTFIY